MKPFTEDAQCPKCMFTAIGAKYCCDPAPEKGCWDVEDEHIHRNCKRCGYGWIEDTIEHYVGTLPFSEEEA